MVWCSYYMNTFFHPRGDCVSAVSGEMTVNNRLIHHKTSIEICYFQQGFCWGRCSKDMSVKPIKDSGLVVCVCKTERVGWRLVCCYACEQPRGQGSRPTVMPLLEKDCWTRHVDLMQCGKFVLCSIYGDLSF